MKTTQLIYYLDDDSDDLFFFREAAESLGHQVETFIEAAALLETLQREAKPDIIFLDVRMPIFKGEEVINVIRRRTDLKPIPIVMISGSYPKSLLHHYIDAGANYMMKKPESDDLKTTLKHILQIDWNNFQAYC